MAGKTFITHYKNGRHALCGDHPVSLAKNSAFVSCQDCREALGMASVQTGRLVRLRGKILNEFLS